MEKNENYIKGLVSIIVLNYNRLEYTKKTISNLIDKTTVSHEFIFVDNGSVDGTREYLSSLEGKTNAQEVRCIFNPSNYGVAGGRNEGLLVANGEYLLTIDDDILVPDDYDTLVVQACDTIPDLGITGVSVERKNYPIKKLNGIEMQVKRGNLGGACLCMPRRVFEQVGYFSPDYVYGGEDCDMYSRMLRLKLISAYIIPKGIHMDENTNSNYVDLKKQAHKFGSKQFCRVGANLHQYKKTGEVYTPYRKPEIDTKSFDKAIKGKK